MARKLSDAQARDVCRRYVEGESELSLSKVFAVARGGIRGYLLRGGVSIRTISEANKIRMARLTPAERLALTAPAHSAVRGKAQSKEHRRKIAATRERLELGVSPGEKRLAHWLRRRGFHSVLQKAIGPYNIDVALEESRVAVDVFGGNWHAGGRHAARFRKRFDYISDRGWIPVIIWITGDYPLQREAIDYIVTLAKRGNASKAPGCQEHVIRGDGKPTGIGKSNLDYRAVVGGDKTGDLVRGHDGRFTNEAIRM